MEGGVLEACLKEPEQNRDSRMPRTGGDWHLAFVSPAASGPFW